MIDTLNFEIDEDCLRGVDLQPMAKIIDILSAVKKLNNAYDKQNFFLGSIIKPKK